MRQPRSIEYPFTFIELRLDDHGSEERMAVATRIVGSSEGRRLQLKTTPCSRLP